MKLFIRKTIMLFIVIMGVSLINYPALATDVGGIIYTDTTWTLSDSPYDMIDRVTVADNVTLTIEPGVVVNAISNDKYFEVWGYLNAIGTDTSFITLNGVKTEPRTSDAVINIQFAVINGGGPFYFCSFGSSFSLRDSKIYNLNKIQAKCGTDSYIERNIFVGCGEIYFVDGVQIRNNVFYEQTEPIRIDGNSAIIEYNSFLSTDRIALHVTSLTADFSATNNFWNTDDTSVIDSMIIDHNDVYGQPYYILYSPFLTEPHPDTPILDLNQAPTSNCGADQVVFDEVTLDGRGSSDPDGSIVSYYWTLQHRTNSANNRDVSGDNPTVSNLNRGFYDVYLTVTDDGALTDTDTMLLAAAGSCSCTASTMYIEAIEPNLLKADKGEKHGQALVKVLDDCGNPVSGVTVYGKFSGDFTDSVSGATGGGGNVLLTTTTWMKGNPAFTFCVDDVSNGTLSYASDDNVETCDSF